MASASKQAALACMGASLIMANHGTGLRGGLNDERVNIRIQLTSSCPFYPSFRGTWHFKGIECIHQYVCSREFCSTANWLARPLPYILVVTPQNLICLQTVTAPPPQAHAPGMYVWAPDTMYGLPICMYGICACTPQQKSPAE